MEISARKKCWAISRGIVSLVISPVRRPFWTCSPVWEFPSRNVPWRSLSIIRLLLAFNGRSQLRGQLNVYCIDDLSSCFLLLETMSFAISAKNKSLQVSSSARSLINTRKGSNHRALNAFSEHRPRRTLELAEASKSWLPILLVVVFTHWKMMMKLMSCTP